MSKLAILKELADVKALVTRRSATKRIGIISVLALAALYCGRGSWSYLTTATRLATNHVQSSIPVAFELERARTMINDLIPDVRRNMMVIAQEEVAVTDLRKDAERASKALAAQREEVLAMRRDLTNEKASFRISNRPATADEMREDLARKFSRFQTAEATVEAKQQLLEAREKSLAAARSKLANMLNAKRDMEVQVEHLESRLKTQQSQAVSKSVELDDTQVAKCKELMDAVRVRLEVADHLLAAQGDLNEMTIPTTVGDIAEQVDQYFAQPRPSGSVLAVVPK